MSPPRTLACLGDSGDIGTWSNIPYYLSQAARPSGFITHTADLMHPRYGVWRRVWNGLAPLRLARAGGFQYSRTNINLMWDRVPEPLRGGEFVSHFQAFPPLDRARRAGAVHSFYIDGTLRQIGAVGPDSRMARRLLADVTARERELYHAARFVVSMAVETAHVLTEDYGVDPAKVYVVRPGANLDEVAVRAYLERRGPSWRRAGPEFGPGNPARLGFIGRDWARKGLPRLVRAAEVLAARGRAVRVTVVGPCPEHFRGHPLVEAVGELNKRTDTATFLATIDRFAIGCLPSYREMLGISTLECLRLGVPVMGAAVGGIPDCVPLDAGFLVPGDATGEAIADAMEPSLFDPARYAVWAANADRHAPGVTWAAAVDGLRAVWAKTATSVAGPTRDAGTRPTA